MSRRTTDRVGALGGRVEVQDLRHALARVIEEARAEAWAEMTSPEKIDRGLTLDRFGRFVEQLADLDRELAVLERTEREMRMAG